MRDLVHFKPNIQQQLALRDIDPMRDEHEWGDYWLYELQDGRILSVTGEVAAKINSLELRVGEAFCIVKRWNGDRRQKARWDVWLAGQSEKVRAVEESSELEDQLRQSLEMAGAKETAPPSPRPEPRRTPPQIPPTAAPVQAHSNVRSLKSADPRQMKLPWEESLKNESRILTDTFASTLKYSSETHGNSVKPEDIRSLVITAYISKRGRGGFNAA